MLVAMWRMSEALPHAIGGGCYHFCYPTAWGRDAFLAAGRPPMVAVCDQRYVFNPVVNDNDLNPSAACPPGINSTPVEDALQSRPPLQYYQTSRPWPIKAMTCPLGN
jgi:hypothetical protein